MTTSGINPLLPTTQQVANAGQGKASKTTSNGIGNTPSRVENGSAQQNEQSCWGYISSLIGSCIDCLSSCAQRIYDFFCSLFSGTKSSSAELPAPAPITPTPAPAEPSLPLAVRQIRMALENMEFAIGCNFKLIFVARLTFESEATPTVLRFVSQTYPPSKRAEDNPRSRDLDAFRKQISAALNGKQVKEFILSRIGMSKKDGPYGSDGLSVHNYFSSDEDTRKAPSDGGTGIGVSYSSPSDVFKRFKEHVPSLCYTPNLSWEEDEQEREDQAYQKQVEAWQFLQTQLTEADFAID